MTNRQLSITENTPTIETERLILRQFTSEDAQDYFAIVSDEELNTFVPWFTIRTLQEARDRLEKNYLQSYGNKVGYQYAICLKSDNRPIGYVCLTEGESNDFGYGLRREFWHKGIATEASKAVVERIGKAGYLYITATHDVNNPRSGVVMRKLGMKYCYSYVNTHWQPKDLSVTFRMYQLNFDGVDRVHMEYWNAYTDHFIESGV